MRPIPGMLPTLGLVFYLHTARGHCIRLLYMASMILMWFHVAASVPRLEMIPGSLVEIVNSTSAGSQGNKHGYEDGSVRRVGNTTHMLVSELISDPMWIRTRLGHWATTNLSGDAGWERVGTLILDGHQMISTANCSDVASHNAALWSPIAFYENNSWFLTYVGYNCGHSWRTANTNGVIKLAKSTLPGPLGIGGPYLSTDDALLAPGPESQAWEGIQGVDSFFAFKSPSNQLLAFYGSSPFGHPWNVGLAQSSSNSINGPWTRLAHGNPLALDAGRTENPIVVETQDGDGSPLLLMVHDFVTQNGGGFGMSWSKDGVHWANSTMIDVPGGCEAPLGILASKAMPQQFTMWFNRRGSYDGLYAAQFKLSTVMDDSLYP